MHVWADMRAWFEAQRLRGPLSPIELPQPVKDLTPMAEPAPLPTGYTTYTNPANVLADEQNKQIEEGILRRLDELQGHTGIDMRWLSVARDNIEQGFMALNRAIFRPQRVRLPGDK